MRQINFSTGEWQNEDLVYTYSNRYSQRPVFIQKNDCIESGTDTTMPDGYDYVGLVFKDKYPKQTRIATECYFEKYGAPLIILANEIDKCDDGSYLLVDYLEIVIWEKGINVWKHRVTDGKDTWELYMGVEFDVPAKKKVAFSAEVKNDMLMIEAEGKKMQVCVKDINDNVYLGILACEGINRFYSLSLCEEAI